MAEPTDSALMLARVRATRVLVRPDNPQSLRRLETVARRAGRVLVDARVGATAGVLLGWPEGSEPPDGQDNGLERREPSPAVLLTFAACLRACWPDPDDELYPGRAVAERQVLSAMATLTASPTGTGEEGGGAERHYKGALRLLRATGLLDPDTSCVRLGPVVALWPAADLAALRSFHDRLPACLPSGAA